MTKRTFVTLQLAMLAAIANSPVVAQPMPIAVDGCAKLARLVYAEVSAAAIYGAGNSGPWLIEIGQGEISVCSHVAKTVSQAFTSAMMSAGLEVSWRRDAYDAPPEPGHYCLSGYLSQCYPNQSPPLSNSTYSANDSLVQESWAVVARAVMREMYNPFSSDEVRFRDNDLKLRLGLSSAIDRRTIDLRAATELIRRLPSRR